MYVVYKNLNGGIKGEGKIVGWVVIIGLDYFKIIYGIIFEVKCIDLC